MTGNPKPEENSARSGSNAEEEAEAEAEVQRAMPFPGEQCPSQKGSPSNQVCTKLPRTHNASILMPKVKTPEMISSRLPKTSGVFPKKGAQRTISQQLSLLKRGSPHGTRDQQPPAPTAAQMKKKKSTPSADTTFALERGAETGSHARAHRSTQPCRMGRADAELPVKQQPFLSGKTNYERNETSSTLMDAPWLPATRGRRGHRTWWGAGAIVAVLRLPPGDQRGGDLCCLAPELPKSACPPRDHAADGGTAPRTCAGSCPLPYSLWAPQAGG